MREALHFVTHLQRETPPRYLPETASELLLSGSLYCMSHILTPDSRVLTSKVVMFSSDSDASDSVNDATYAAADILSNMATGGIVSKATIVSKTDCGSSNSRKYLSGMTK